MRQIKKTSKTVYESKSGDFKLRNRKGRNIEVAFSSSPNMWTTTGTTNMDEALEYAMKCLKADRRIGTGNEITFKEFAENFFSRTDERSQHRRDINYGKEKSAYYYASNQSRVNNFLIPKFGGYRLSAIRDIDIESWYVSTKTKDGKKELSPSSKLKILNALNIILEAARREGLIDVNPCDKVEKVADNNKKRRQPFTVEEVQKLFPYDIEKLIEIWGSLKWATYFSIMVDSGFRAGEVAGLSKSSFISSGVYSVSSVDAYTKQIKRSFKTSNKGQNYKVAILSSYTMELVEMYLKNMPEGQEYLFLTEKGGPMTPEVSNKHLKCVLKKAGIPINGRTQHCLRHFFDTYMLNNLGVDVKTADVKELMAHTGYRPEYDHRTPTDIVKRLEKVRPVINSIRGAL